MQPVIRCTPGESCDVRSSASVNACVTHLEEQGEVCLSDMGVVCLLISIHQSLNTCHVCFRLYTSVCLCVYSHVSTFVFAYCKRDIPEGNLCPCWQAYVLVRTIGLLWMQMCVLQVCAHGHRHTYTWMYMRVLSEDFCKNTCISWKWKVLGKDLMLKVVCVF